MSGFIDLTGQRFGRLVAIRRDEKKVGGKIMWVCKCDCGNTKSVASTHLRSGAVKSCGCLHNELLSKRSKTHGATIGRNEERLYGVWKCMKQRCENPNAGGYKNYGGRGIRVCEQWHDYSNFREWAFDNGYDSEAPRGKCTLDRIDNDGCYEPDNCRWVDMFVQANNKRPKIAS